MKNYQLFIPNPLTEGMDLCAPRVFTDGRSCMLAKGDVLLPTERQAVGDV